MDEAFSALTTIWRERGFSPADLRERMDGTLQASDRALSIDSKTIADDAQVPDGGSVVAEPLEVGDELGRGGMGVVYVARQSALRRDVAAKRLHVGGTGLRSLLKEAWVGGHLEHPNIVPVHTLAEGPTVVMKRIEGTSWREHIREPDTVPERSDPLGWHIGVLLAVCDAIEFAHARGVLHLDLKPDNVMVGEFGEVYVLDWGLAAGHGEAAPPWLTCASELRSVAGTPDYMAPELAKGEGAAIGPHTDIYLLGAMLHEVVTGRPPHRGEMPMQKLFRAFLSEPYEHQADVPEELVQLLHRAMHVDAEQRFEDVDAFRGALRAFLSHREAAGFADEAQAQLSVLDDDSQGEVALWQTFGECRFALREAETGWPEHPDVPALKARLAERMARHAMRLGRLELAEAFLSELDAPPPRLRARLDGLLEKARASAARVEELEHMARDHDLDTESRFRSRLAIWLGFFFLLFNASLGFIEREGIVELGYGHMFMNSVLTVLLIAPYVWWKREPIFRNRANAAIWWVCIAVFFAIQGLWVIGLSVDMPIRSALALTLMFYLLAFGSMTMLVSTRFFASPLIMVVAVVMAAMFPEWVYEVIAVGGCAAATGIGLSHRARRADA